MDSMAYLDNSATTRPSEGVAAAMAESMREGYFNPSSLYAPAMRAEQALRICREAVARAVFAEPDGVIFTSGGTEANNLAILGSVTARRGPVRAVVTAAEHPSVLSAFDELRAQGHEVTVIPVGRAGQLDWDALDVDGSSVKEMHDKLNACLEEAADALTAGDCVLLGDLLEYELAPQAEAEVKIVSLLRDRAQG